MSILCPYCGGDHTINCWLNDPIKIEDRTMFECLICDSLFWITQNQLNKYWDLRGFTTKSGLVKVVFESWFGIDI